MLEWFQVREALASRLHLVHKRTSTITAAVARQLLSAPVTDYTADRYLHNETYPTEDRVKKPKLGGVEIVNLSARLVSSVVYVSVSHSRMLS